VQLSAITRYWIKSCRGEQLTEAGVLPWGLDGDRRWMLIDDAGKVVTGREHPRLVLVSPRRTGSALRLSAPGHRDLDVAEPDGNRQLPVTLWSSQLTAAPADDAAHRWFSELINTSVRLVFLDDPTRRPVDPRYGRASDVFSLADGYPLLLTTEASLAALNDLIVSGPRPDEAPLPMNRFRPNLVVSGAAAWAEDEWKQVRIGAATFRAVKACDRCVFTTIDANTAAKGREPLITLARHRSWDGKIWFGMNLIPDITDRDAPPPMLRVGDRVEVY